MSLPEGTGGAVKEQNEMRKTSITSGIDSILVILQTRPVPFYLYTAFYLSNFLCITKQNEMHCWYTNTPENTPTWRRHFCCDHMTQQ